MATTPIDNAPRSPLYERLRRFHARIRRGGSRRRTLWILVPGGADATNPLERFLNEVRGRGTLALEARCGGPGAAPFGVVRDWLQAAGRRFEEVLGATDGLVGPAEDAPSGGEDGAAGAALGEELVARFEAIRRTLQSLAGDAPLLLVVRDGHRADTDTLALLDHLSARLALARAAAEGGRESHIGMIATFGPPAPSHVAVGGRAGTRGTPLGVLSDTAEIEVVEADPPAPEALAEVLAAAAVRDKLQQLSGGDPDRLRALLLALPVEAPALEALARETLQPADRRMLDALALLDRPALPGELMASAALDAEAFDAALGRLAAMDAVRRTAGRIALGALFDGATLRSRLAEDERRALHLRLAQALAAAGATAVGPAARAALGEEIARHLLRGGARERGRSAALAAAQGLVAARTPYRAGELLALADELAPSVDGDVAGQRVRADVDELVGAVDAAVALRRRLLEASRGGPDEASEGQRLGALLLRRGAPVEAARVLTDARRAAGDGDPEQRARIAALLAEASFRAGDAEHAERTARAALAEAALLGLPDALLTAGQALGKLLATQGRDDEADEVFARMLAAADAADRPRDAARALHNLGVLALGRGALIDARRHFDACLARSERAGLLLGVGLALTNLAVVHAHTQQLGAAVRAMRRAVAAFEDLDDAAHLAVALGDLSSLLLQVGDLTGARRAATRARTLAQAVGQRRLVAIAQLREAEVALEEGRWGQAEADLREARDEFALLEDDLDRGWALLGLARVAEGLRDASSVFAFLEEIEALALPAASELRGMGLLVRSRVHLAEERPDAAEAALDEALVTLDGAGAPIALAEALSRKARMVARTRDADSGARERSLALHAEAQALLGEIEATLPESLRASFRARRAVARTLAAARRAERDDGRENGEARAAEGVAGAAPLPPPPDLAPKAGATAEWRARFPAIRGGSRALHHVLQMVDRFAAVDATVLLLGDSGVGKELVAEALHRLSPRRDGPFERINAAALTETLLLSELFGHEKGAFTGAVQRVRGAFERAHGGTIFLDEIGDISPGAQVSLLRVLQEKEVQRVGGARPIRVDVRVVCATNRDLENLVAEGRFRLDLYHRIRGLTIRVPPLRERPDDVGPIAQALLAEVAQDVGHPVALSEDALPLLAAQPWPGNVRELQNVLRSVAVLTDAATLRARDFVEHAGLDARAVPAGTSDTLASAPFDGTAAEGPVLVPPELDVGFSLADAKRQLEVSCIKRALAKTGGNITHASRLLGMKRPRLSQKIKELGIIVPH